MADDLDLVQIAERYTLCGGAILNPVRQVCLNAISDGSHRLTLDALQTAIAREHDKEGREA